MRKDFWELVKKYRLSTFGMKKELIRFGSEIKEEELVKHMQYANSFAIFDKNLNLNLKEFGRTSIFMSAIEEKLQEFMSSGYMFISDKRILFSPLPRQRWGGNIIEFPLDRVQSVYIHPKEMNMANACVSFSTDKLRIIFRIDNSTDEVKIAAILEGAVQTTLTKYSQEQYGSVKCYNCGASKIVKKGYITKCDYCDSPLEVGTQKNNEDNAIGNIVNKEMSTSVADEIIKFKALLDSGVITPEEFEHKKRKLLGM